MLPRPTHGFPRARRARGRWASRRHPQQATSYQPLGAKTRELIKLGMAIGIRSEGAVHSHVGRALKAGASPEEIRHSVLLGIPTLGLPTTVAAFTWVDDILDGRSKVRRGSG